MPLNRGKLLNQRYKTKQSAGHVNNKPLWMTHRAFKAKNKKYFYWKKVQES